MTNNQIDGSGAGIAIEGSNVYSGYPSTLNNFTIAYNVVTNAPVGFANWGGVNGAQVYGNIFDTPSGDNSIALGPNSKNISIYNNLMEAYTYINTKSPPVGYSMSNNVALTNAFLGSSPSLPFGTNNTVNTALASVLQQALAAPPGLAQLTAVCEAFFDHLQRRTFPGGCFMASAALEMGTRPGPVKELVAASIGTEACIDTRTLKKRPARDTV